MRLMRWLRWERVFLSFWFVVPGFWLEKKRKRPAKIAARYDICAGQADSEVS
jgi:hypothetical protein